MYFFDFWVLNLYYKELAEQSKITLAGRSNGWPEKASTGHIKESGPPPCHVGPPMAATSILPQPSTRARQWRRLSLPRSNTGDPSSAPPLPPNEPPTLSSSPRLRTTFTSIAPLLHSTNPSLFLLLLPSSAISVREKDKNILLLKNEIDSVSGDLLPWAALDPTEKTWFVPLTSALFP